MLVERDASLRTLSELLDAAAAGHGNVVLVSGEAGVGKTTLVRTAVERAAERFVVRRGSCDDLTTAAALGPLLEAVPELGELAASDADQLVLLRTLLGLFRSGPPTLLVLEDVHWADGATLDALRYLGRRTDDLALLVVATYRAEAVAARPALQRMLGELTTARRVELEPLSAAGVAELVSSTGSSAGLDASVLHAETGGNPFYVTEVLAGAGSGVPATVRDAVLARTAGLSAGAQHVLAAAAVLGRAPLVAITAVADGTDRDVDECVTNGVLVWDGGECMFRHELARRAVDSTLAPGLRAGLHRRALGVLVNADDRRLAHHAVSSGDSARVLRHAVAAADRAARLGAHREAAEQYLTALRHGNPDDEQRIRLLQARSYECYLTDQLEAALAARLEVLELAEAAGDPLTIGDTARWLSRLCWYLGRNAASERYAHRAVETLTPLGDSSALAMAISNVAQLRMLAGDNPAAISSGRAALAIARAVGDRDTEIHALNNIGTATFAAGDRIEGAHLLARSLDLALTADAHEHAARAYTNLVSLSVQTRDYAAAERHARAGISYCTERDLDSWRCYMSAGHARALLEQGDLDGAAERSASVLANADLSPITRIVATSVSATVAARRGGVVTGLDEVLALAAQTGEAQRLVPVAVARAEVAWLDGRQGDIVAEVEHAWAAAAAEGNGWYLGELSWWLEVAGSRRAVSVEPARPFALMHAGDWVAATQAWDELGCPFWSATALSRLPDLDSARRAVALVRHAPAFEHALLRDRAAAGLAVPRGPRRAHRNLPHQLTARELEVLRLLADGLSNAEVGATLFLSQKTVGHHVSAVLRKLGEPSRSRAVATARREGIVGPT